MHSLGENHVHLVKKLSAGDFIGVGIDTLTYPPNDKKERLHGYYITLYSASVAYPAAPTSQYAVEHARSL